MKVVRDALTNLRYIVKSTVTEIKLRIAYHIIAFAPKRELVFLLKGAAVRSIP
jgi:hypothetical protein